MKSWIGSGADTYSLILATLMTTGSGVSFAHFDCSAQAPADALCMQAK